METRHKAELSTYVKYSTAQRPSVCPWIRMAQASMFYRALRKCKEKENNITVDVSESSGGSSDVYDIMVEAY
jgi:hypothetical protein